MNLQPLFETQKLLDDRIVEQHGLEGLDLLPEKILALQVELGELANEWRGFKFWSEDQEPRGERECPNCGGECHRLVFVGTPNEHEENCEECGGEGVTNKLLEEYADCLHFLLSIGLDIKADKLDYQKVMRLQEAFGITYLEDNLTKQFGLVFYFIPEFEETRGSDEYTDVLLSFLRLGEILGFTWEQIEAAYFAKNHINHTRQATGY